MKGSIQYDPFMTKEKHREIWYINIYNCQSTNISRIYRYMSINKYIKKTKENRKKTKNSNIIERTAAHSISFFQIKIKQDPILIDWLIDWMIGWLVDEKKKRFHSSINNTTTIASLSR